MKLLITITVITICSITPILSLNFQEFQSNKTYFTGWLDLPLDHFNLFDNRTWNMKFFVNRKFFQKGGPIFLVAGGEWTTDASMLRSGQLFKLAKKHNGIILETEHRYYSKSLPFGHDFSTKNLQYLQVEQALEDLAYFIENLKTTVRDLENSKVVIHGCSYPGMLATWMRLKYPHIVDIAYASSAPLGVGLDYPEYFEIVNDVYANVSEACIASIREGFKSAQRLLKTKKGRKEVRSALKDWDCGDISDMNSAEIIQTMASVLNTQHDPVNFEDIACLTLSMDTDDTGYFKRLAKLIVDKSKYVPYYCGSGESSKEDDRNGISWSYQTCTELGTFQTLSQKNSKHPFTIDASLEESVEECVNDFGEMVTEETLKTGTERVTRRYGGLRPKVTRVLTIQGKNDPWRGLSSLEDYTPEAPVFLIEGSHCSDVSPDEDDPPAMIEMREKIRNIISKWLEEIS